MLNQRDKSLISLILEKRSGIFGKELAKNLNVSDRTIRNDIKRINEELFDCGLQISSDLKHGYFLTDNDYYGLIKYMDDNFGT